MRPDVDAAHGARDDTRIDAHGRVRPRPPCKADAALVARDRALPGLGLVLDAEALADSLRRLPGLADTVAVEPAYVRYKPGTNCVVALRVQRRAGGMRPLYVKALTAERFAEAWARPRWQAAVQAGATGAPQAIEAQSVLVLGPQHDRGVPALARLAEPVAAGRLLRTMFPQVDEVALAALTGATAGAAAPRQEPEAGVSAGPVSPGLFERTLRWKPERRWVGRLTLPGGTDAVLRAGTGPAFGRALLGATVGAAHGGALLLAAHGPRQILATGWLPGRVLCPAQAGGLDAAQLVRVGTALAQVHGSRFVHPLARGRRDEAASLTRAVEGLRPLDTTLAARAEAVLALVQRALSALPASEPVLIHGDFSLDQVVDDGAALRFIDWDRSVRGEAAADLGSCWARLEYQVIEGALSATGAEAAIAALRDGHAAETGAATAGVRVHAAAALLRLCAEPFRERVPDWPARVDALIGRAEALLGSGRANGSAVAERAVRPAHVDAPGTAVARATASRGDDEWRRLGRVGMPGEPIDAAMPMLDTALDTTLMRAPLAAALGGSSRPARVVVDAARLVRHKPGRRALVDYTVRLPDGHVGSVLGKLRAKGLDRTGHGVQRALWQQRHAGRAFDVPEPLAAIPELHLWLQRRVPGRPASECFRPEADTVAAARIGTALAALHRADVDSGKRWTNEDELVMLRGRLAAAARVRPQLAERIAQLATGCTALAARLPAPPTACLHRDFYPDQVLVPAPGADADADADAGVPVLLDFDLCALGDPALDAGNFVAHVIEQALRRHGDPAALDAHAQAFVAAFLAEAPQVEATAVELHTTLSLARHVDLSTRFEDRHGTTGALLALCEARLARAGR